MFIVFKYKDIIDIYSLIPLDIKIAMGRNKYINSKENQNIVKLLRDGNTTLEVAEMLDRDHRMMKRENENFGKNKEE